uniref:Retrotransposon gag domain-containing protein n=1 Tax=Cucumis sativus TaxID=3659 RepID=A0A0A0KFN3_CUCSA
MQYYPITYCEPTRDEFLGLKQGSISVAEYERKYTELSRYANVILASESERCQRFFSVSGDCHSCGVEYNIREISREQRRFTPGVKFSSRQDFKNRSRGQASRNMSYGSVFQSQSQSIPNQSNRSTVRPQPSKEFVASTVRRTPCTSCGKNHRGHFKKDYPQLNMIVQKDQGVGSQTVE